MRSMRKKISRGKSKRIFKKTFAKNQSRRKKQSKRNLMRGGYRL